MTETVLLLYSGDNLIWISQGVKNSCSSEAPKCLPRFEPPVGPTVRTKSAKTPLAVLGFFWDSCFIPHNGSTTVCLRRGF